MTTMTSGVSTDGGIVWIVGTNFGPPSQSSSAVNVSVVNTNRSTVLPCVLAGPVSGVDSSGAQSLSCVLGPGVGAQWVLRMSVGGQSVANTVPFAFAPPVLTTVDPPTGDTAGGFNVTLTGTNLGSEAFVSVWVVTAVAVGSLPLPPVQVPIESFDGNTVAFVMPAGQGVLWLYVTVDGQQSNLLQWTYAPPTIAAMAPSVLPTNGYTGATPTVVTLTGTSFGSTGAIVEWTFPPYSYTLAPDADYLNPTDPNGTPVTFTRELPAVNCTSASTASVCTLVSQSDSEIKVCVRVCVE